MNLSKLPNCISPREFTNYQSNGSGRDSYIVYQNGGLEKNKIIYESGLYDRRRFLSQEKNSLQHLPQLTPKIQHYQGDGTGRDFYIKVNDGGLLTNNYKHNHIKSLRSYHKIQQIRRNNDYLRISHLTDLQKQRKQQFSQIQRQQILRLCNQKNKSEVADK